MATNFHILMVCLQTLVESGCIWSTPQGLVVSQTGHMEQAKGECKHLLTSVAGIFFPGLCFDRLLWFLKALP